MSQAIETGNNSFINQIAVTIAITSTVTLLVLGIIGALAYAGANGAGFLNCITNNYLYLTISIGIGIPCLTVLGLLFSFMVKRIKGTSPAATEITPDSPPANPIKQTPQFKDLKHYSFFAVSLTLPGRSLGKIKQRRKSHFLAYFIFISSDSGKLSRKRIKQGDIVVFELNSKFSDQVPHLLDPLTKDTLGPFLEAHPQHDVIIDSTALDNFVNSTA
jgi:hypothetical protein